MSDVTERACTKCGVTKPLEDFNRKKGGKYGRLPRCKVCERAYQRQWSAANKERVAATHRRYREANKDKVAERNRRYREANRERRNENSRRWNAANKERLAELNRRWYAANKERHRATQREWYAADPTLRLEANRRWRESNKEKMAASARRYREANPETVTAGRRRRRARLNGAEGSHTDAEWGLLLDEYNGLCAYCEVAPATERDHLQPISRGGSDYIDNIVPVCKSCNTSKGNKFLWEWQR